MTTDSKFTSQTSFSKLAVQAVSMLGVMTLITGIAYPLVITCVAKVAFPEQANGSMIVKGNTLAGSKLIGQPFEDPRHFWSRPSATTPGAYNAAASTGSNLGSTNDALTKNAKARIDGLRAADPENTAPVPVDLVTSSGSGLDPNISPAAAEYQIHRVARARGMAEERVRAVVAKHTAGRDIGFLGEPRVNLLLVNLELDEQKTP